MWVIRDSKACKYKTANHQTVIHDCKTIEVYQHNSLSVPAHGAVPAGAAPSEVRVRSLPSEMLAMRPNEGPTPPWTTAL